MTPRIPSAVVIAVVTSATLAAQDRRGAAPSDTVTVTGCIQRMDESGSPGTTIPERTPTPEQGGVLANRSEPGSGFMLIDAAPVKNKSGARGSAQHVTRVRYVLIGDDAEIAKYQGQRVRAQGQLPSAPTKPAETAPVGTSGSIQLSNTARLKVTSIERLAADCK